MRMFPLHQLARALVPRRLTIAQRAWSAAAFCGVSDAECDIGDDFCTLWHLLDLLPERAAGVPGEDQLC
jgi:hypothetical protein